MVDKITSPFTPPQVEALNRWQRTDWVHAFTCADRNTPAHHAYAKAHGQGDHGILTATRDGWVCPVCGYRQNWAHGFMLDPPRRPPWHTDEGPVP
jgi:hypothetical protein